MAIHQHQVHGIRQCAAHGFIPRGHQNRVQAQAPEHALHQPAVVLVVFGHQNPAGIAPVRSSNRLRAVGQVAGQHLVEPLLVDRLGQVLVTAGHPIFRNILGHDISRKGNNGRIDTCFTNRLGGIPAVHDRHLDIHQDQVEVFAPYPFQGFGTVSHMHQLGAGTGHQQGYQPPVHFVVFGTQDPARQPRCQHHGDGPAALAEFRGIPQEVHLLQAAGADGNLEFAALAVGTGYPDIPSQQLRQPAGNTQPQPGATVLAGNGGAALGERIKQPLQLLRLHANTGIHHPGNQGFSLAVTADNQGDRAAFREFQRICTQIDDDLPVSGGVRADLLW